MNGGRRAAVRRNRIRATPGSTESRGEQRFNVRIARAPRRIFKPRDRLACPILDD
jgi:hypothetical protein